MSANRPRTIGGSPRQVPPHDELSLIAPAARGRAAEAVDAPPDRLRSVEANGKALPAIDPYAADSSRKWSVQLRRLVVVRLYSCVRFARGCPCSSGLEVVNCIVHCIQVQRKQHYIFCSDRLEQKKPADGTRFRLDVQLACCRLPGPLATCVVLQRIFPAAAFV